MGWWATWRKPVGVTSDRRDPRLGHGVDEAPVDQNDVYLVLDDAERSRGFVRPLRRSYKHTGGCGTVTTMGEAIAETYAREPHFYGATYCCGCLMHRPVGEAGEFHWIERDGSLGPKVGT